MCNTRYFFKAANELSNLSYYYWSRTVIVTFYIKNNNNNNDNDVDTNNRCDNLW